MTLTSPLVIQKLISMLQNSLQITHWMSPNNIYGSHISTIQDYVLPAISIHPFESPGRETSGPFFEQMIFQIDVWMRSVGANANTWDDTIMLHEAVTDLLHRCGGWDDVLGIKILEITNIQNGPQMEENEDGIMHYPSIWFVRATQ